MRTTMQKRLWGVLFALILGMCPLTVSAQVADLYVFIEFGDGDLGLINTETDQMIQVNLLSMAGWPGSTPQHAWLPADGKTIYVSVDATESDPAAVVVIKVAGINWAAGSANLAIDKVLVLDPPGTPSILPLVEEVNALQPVRDWGCALRPKRSTSQEVSQNQEPCCIASWIQPRFTQGHGPSFLPGTPFMYLTLWTDNRIRVLDSRTNTFAATDPQSFHEYSDQTHGVNCNASGTYCLGTGYFYDQNEIEVYLADPDTGGLNLVRSIELCEGKGNKCAALTHYTAWLDDRFALTATMQFGPTSLTPPRSKIIGPSVWLLDVYSDRGVQTIGTASGRNAPGIFRSASDLQVVGDKLYVAEEDTLDGSFGDDGYISVFDISNLLQPRFLKRFKPGEELPNDYCISHGMNVTPDGQFLYVTSYACSYIVKIDTTTDEVVKIYGAADGLNGPHGAFIAGQQR